MQNIPETVKHLLIINVIFFLATLVLGDIVYDLFALHYPSNPKFEFWQPLTHMFMHGDFSHIFFNMFGLYMFGTPIEQMWGRKKFIFFYLSTGFGAAALQLGPFVFDHRANRKRGFTGRIVNFQFGYGRCFWSTIWCFGSLCVSIS
jgi:membrane associated rhomboid family serine protease